MQEFRVRRKAPKSSTERQRDFRERHPGYYQRLHAERRAALKAYSEKRRAIERMMAIKPEPLMLPAPVETIEIPGMNMIPARMTIPAAPLLVPVPVSYEI